MSLFHPNYVDVTPIRVCTVEALYMISDILRLC